MMNKKTAIHGGNTRELAEQAGCPHRQILDFSASINPFGPPEWITRRLRRVLEETAHYPDSECKELVLAAAKKMQVASEEVVFGNGSSELLWTIPKLLSVKRAIIPSPAYVDYFRAAQLAKLSVEPLILDERQNFRLDLNRLENLLRGEEAVFLGQPNNPTGQCVDVKNLRELARANSGTIFLVDEAFADFVAHLDRLTHDRPSNVIVLYSLTKFYAIPGLRLGCAVMDSGLAQLVKENLPPWSVNQLALAAGESIFSDCSDYKERISQQVHKQKELLIDALQSIEGLRVFPSDANFLLIRLESPLLNSNELARRLLQQKIAIRVCAGFEGLDERYFRIAVRTEEENQKLCEAIKQCLSGNNFNYLNKSNKPKNKTPAIMFQGTCSGAGKSLLTAAFCRILLQDGYRVAPFKAQNMALNSFVGKGGEMGRAQALQAQACRIEPDVRMNPVLLKPNSDTGSQVIVLGKSWGNMEVGKYHLKKKRMVQIAREAYDSLAVEHEVMVLEGAGSPAEVNLRNHDFVNMEMAAHAQAPVLIVGDIDKGGVLAALVGTMELLAEKERAMVAGFIINRFRGKQELLQSAVEYLESYTGKDVLGIVPYISQLLLPEEDSVALRSRNHSEITESDKVDVAVIELPHIANFTDFDPFIIEPDVCLRMVRTVEELGAPDTLILPGSKSVCSDLRYLKQQGWDEKIKQLFHAGHTEIVGICGGFQMLGKEIDDPMGIESAIPKMSGIGLLPINTVMAPQKKLACTSAKHLPSGLEVRGYEIHHGQTQSLNGARPIVLSLPTAEGTCLGIEEQEGRAWGTYLHGIFDDDHFRRWFIDRLRLRRGRAPLGEIVAAWNLEPMIEKLATAVRANIDVARIYRHMGLRA